MRGLRALLISILISAFLTPFLSFGTATPAGTVIKNSVTVTYADSAGNQYSGASNEVAVTVSRIYGVEITPPTDERTNVAPGSSIICPATIKNIGNTPDTFSISAVSDQGWTVRVYPDLNHDRTLQDGERIPVYSTPSLNPDGTYDVIIEVLVPSDAPMSTKDTTRMTATSTGDGSKSDRIELTTTVGGPSLSLLKNSDRNEVFPGEEINYTITVSNTGTASAYNLSITDQIPAYTSYVPGSVKVINDTIANVSFEGNNSLIRWSIGELASGVTKKLEFKVKVGTDAPNGYEILNKVLAGYEYPNGRGRPQISAEMKVMVKTQPGISLSPDNSSSVEAGVKVSYAFSAVNTGNVSDTFDLTISSSTGLNWSLYIDRNGNGVIDRNIDPPISDTDGDGMPDTGQIDAGSSIKLIAVTTIPPGTADKTVDKTSVMGRSSRNPSLTDSVNFTTTVKAPKVTVSKKVIPEGDQPPGTVLTYVIEYHNDGTGTAYSVVLTDAIPPNTSYVENSVTVDGASKTDTPNDDDGVSVVNRVVTVNVGDLLPGTGGRITFKVKIE
ncbi:DUF11 domain-containing protein [Candidatus Poribacteria bacterium]|nr:DUF11 domain-containing protein [Candidatus Poribacteria bacterium]